MRKTINHQPGIITTDTETTSRKYWRDSDKIRFVRALPQKLNGWEKHIDEMLDGICRGMLPWLDNDGVARAAFGTDEKLQVLDNDILNNVTPARITGQLTNPFTTTSGSAIVRVAHSNHGEASGDHVFFDNASAVGGITIDGEYTVTSIVDNNNYEITHSSPASSSAGPGGGTVDYIYEIHAGTESATQGQGYGVGTYGTGTYGTARSSFILLPPRTWQIEQWGEWILACPRGGEISVFQNNVANRATIIPNAPTNNASILVTEEKHLFALGADGDKMGLMWSNQDDYDNWTLSDQSTSGERELTGASEILCGVRTRGGNLILTDAAPWFAQFIGGQDVFGFEQVAGGHAGIISPKAAVDVDGIVLWMGFNDFYLFDGVVRRIPRSRDISDYVYNNLADEQKAKCFAYAVTARSEVWWFYPQSEEITHYVKFNYAPENRCWDIGTMVRTAGVDRGIFNNPFLCGADQFIYSHELKNNYDADGAAMNEFIISGPLRWGDGDREIEIVGFEPDFKDIAGNISVTMIQRHNAMGTDENISLDTVTSASDFSSVRAAGREIDTKIHSSDAGTFWRLGQIIYDILPGAFR